MTTSRHYLCGRRQALDRIEMLPISAAEIACLPEEDKRIIRGGLGHPDTPAKRESGMGRFGFASDADVETYRGWDDAIAEHFA